MGVSSSYDEDYIFINWRSRKNNLVSLNDGFGISFNLSDSILTPLDGNNSGMALTKKKG
jgi:hypothetical protein